MKRLFLLFLCIAAVLSCLSCDGITTTLPDESTRHEASDDTQFIPDTTVGTNIEPINAEKVILDWKESIETYLDKMSKENSQKLYFNASNEEASVICYYLLTKKNVAEYVIEKQDMKDLLPKAVISPLSSIKMIMIKFDMDDFTQEACDILAEIANAEPLIESIKAGIEGGFCLAYIPNIERHCKDAAKIEHTALSPILADESNGDFIITSKAEYDSYIDLMKTKCKTDYHLELLETQRSLYDDVFFLENALIITRVIVRGSGSIKLSVDSVYTSGDKAYVVVQTIEPGGFGTADMQYKSFSISVKKSDVANVKELITLD